MTSTRNKKRNATEASIAIDQDDKDIEIISSATATTTTTAKNTARSGSKDDESDTTPPQHELALWGDRIRPITWSGLTFHQPLNERLYRIANKCRPQMPNMLFHGPRGSGKRTRVSIFVRSLFTETRAGASLLDGMIRHQILSVDVTRRFGTASTAKTEKHIGAMLGASGKGEDEKQDDRVAAEFDQDDDNKDGPLKRTNRAAPSSSSSNKKHSSLAGAAAQSSLSAANTVGSSIEIACITSPYHLEVTPSDAGRKDIHVIRSCLRHLCQATAPPTSMFSIVDPSAVGGGRREKKAENGGTHDQKESNNESGVSEEKVALPSYRVIIINQADKLSSEAQAALRCTMEEYAKRVRFVLICEHLSNVLDAIQSRCLMVRVPRPTRAAMAAALANVASRALVRFASPAQKNGYMERLLDVAHDDISFAISLLENNNSVEQPLTKRAQLELPDWITVTLGITGVVFDGRAAQEQTAAAAGASSKKEVAKHSSVAAAAAANKVYRGPSIDQLQRVHRTFLELLTRCVPTRRLLHEMLYMFLDLVAQEYVSDRLLLGTLQREVCAVFGFFEPRIATAHRAIIQLNALFVHLNELFSRNRAGLPLLAVTTPDDLFPRRRSRHLYQPRNSGGGSGGCVPPLTMTEQDIAYIKRHV